MKHFIALILLSVFWIVFWLSTGYFYGWWVPTHYFKPTAHLIWFIPFSVYCWALLVNGKEKFWRRLYIYPLIIIGFFITLNIVANLAVSSYISLNLPGWARISMLVLAILLVLLLWNYLFALYEGKKLNWLMLLVLFGSQFSMILFHYIWGLVLFVLTKDDYSFSVGSGGIVFAFILHEGIFYLWIKGKFRLTSKPIG
jgi:hypothetical protein